MGLHIGNNISIPQENVVIIMDVLSKKDNPVLEAFLNGKSNNYRSVIVTAGKEGTVLYGSPVTPQALFGRYKRSTAGGYYA